MLRRLAAPLALALVFCAPLARADIRVWEEHPEDPGLHRDLWLTGYLQPGYIWRQDDPNGLNPNQDNNFWVQRARIGFKAQLQRYLFLRIQYDARGNALADAYVDARFHPAFGVMFGQYQTPFLRTWLYSDSKLAFIDRVVYTPQAQDRAALAYLQARDIGFTFHGAVPFAAGDTAPTLQYWVGMYLGQGPNASNNIDDAYMYTARVQLDALGRPVGEDAQSDLARSTTPRVSVGGGVYSNCDDRDIWNRGWTADAELRYQGLFVGASFVWFKTGPSSGLGNSLGYGGSCVGTPGLGPQIATGGSAQAGYVLPAIVTGRDQSVEVVARFDQVNAQSPCNADTGQCSFFGGGSGTPGYVAPDNLLGDNPPSRYRITTGLNFFPNNKQQLRLSLDYQINRETENIQKSGVAFKGVKNDVIWFQITAGL